MPNTKLRILKETAVLGSQHKPGDEVEVADRDMVDHCVKRGLAEIVKPEKPNKPAPVTTH